MIRLLILLITLGSTVITSNAKQSSPPIPGDWQLVFEDNFDYLDTTKWNTDLPDERISVGSKDACFFIPENVQVKDGKLELISRKQKLQLQNRNGKTIKKNYSSGQINSFAKFTPQYGYFEARMKLPLSKGLWPAFWLMPNRISPKIWSTFRKDDGQGMEIDIMEHLTEWGPNRFHYAAHWDGYRHARKSISGFYSKSSTDDYRNFGLYWGKNILIWFIDGQEVYRWQSERVADIPLHLILSTQMGGWATDHIEDLPAITYVDHVKVWSGEPKPNPVYDYDTKEAQRQGRWIEQGRSLISYKARFFGKDKINSLTWQAKLKTGRYKIYAKWSEPKKELNHQAEFEVKHSYGNKFIRINQNQHYGYWYPLGEYDLNENSKVQLKTDSKNEVLASQIRYQKL